MENHLTRDARSNELTLRSDCPTLRTTVQEEQAAEAQCAALSKAIKVSAVDVAVGGCCAALGLRAREATQSGLCVGATGTDGQRAPTGSDG